MAPQKVNATDFLYSLVIQEQAYFKLFLVLLTLEKWSTNDMKLLVTEDKIQHYQCSHTS